MCAPPDPKLARLFVLLGWFAAWDPTVGAASTAVAEHQPEAGSQP